MGEPWLSVPLVCPEFPTCALARTFCLSKQAADGFMEFSCHAGSVWAYYECATNSMPLTNCTGEVAPNPCAQLPVNLGAAGHFSVLAGPTITNTGPSQVIGDMGVSPGSAVTGFDGPGGPGHVLQGSTIEKANIASAAGIFDLTVAYNDAAARTLCPISRIGDLGGMTLTPGLYKSTGGMGVATSDLFLDAQHDGEAVFIFQMATTFISAAGKKIILMNGAKASNIFWQVGTSGTLGGSSTFEGTMMADQSIGCASGAVVNGRVLARIAAVNLAANIITIPPSE